MSRSQTCGRMFGPMGRLVCGFDVVADRLSLLLRRPYLMHRSATPSDGSQRSEVVEGLCACDDRYVAEKPTVDGLKARLVCR